MSIPEFRPLQPTVSAAPGADSSLYALNMLQQQLDRRSERMAARERARLAAEGKDDSLGWAKHRETQRANREDNENSDQTHRLEKSKHSLNVEKARSDASPIETARVVGMATRGMNPGQKMNFLADSENVESIQKRMPTISGRRVRYDPQVRQKFDSGQFMPWLEKTYKASSEDDPRVREIDNAINQAGNAYEGALRHFGLSALNVEKYKGKTIGDAVVDHIERYSKASEDFIGLDFDINREEVGQWSSERMEKIEAKMSQEGTIDLYDIVNSHGLMGPIVANTIGQVGGPNPELFSWDGFGDKDIFMQVLKNGIIRLGKGLMQKELSDEITKEKTRADLEVKSQIAGLYRRGQGSEALFSQIRDREYDKRIGRLVPPADIPRPDGAQTIDSLNLEATESPFRGLSRPPHARIVTTPGQGRAGPPSAFLKVTPQLDPYVVGPGEDRADPPAPLHMNLKGPIEGAVAPTLNNLNLDYTGAYAPPPNTPPRGMLYDLMYMQAEARNYARPPREQSSYTPSR